MFPFQNSLLKKNDITGNENELILKKIRKSYTQQDISEKLKILSKLRGIDLRYIGATPYDPQVMRGNIENPIGMLSVPIGLVGPISIQGQHFKDHYYAPMATTEGALIATYNLGARLLSFSDPIKTETLKKVVHITAMFPFNSRQDCERIQQFVHTGMHRIKNIAERDSRHTLLLDIEHHIVNDNYLLKFRYDTGDAQGLNMINHATFAVCQYISDALNIDFFHRSHFNPVKHHCPLNEIEGYGHHVKASAVINRKALENLSVTAKSLKDFFDRCTACAQASGVDWVNVHAANAISAIYLACGQDMADISSAHVCRSRTEIINYGQDLYWEIEIPNLLIGTVGGGTTLPTQKECLQIMGCYGSGKVSEFAEKIAATVLAGEFPTAAAVVNKTYVQAHNHYGGHHRSSLNIHKTR